MTFCHLLLFLRFLNVFDVIIVLFDHGSHLASVKKITEISYCYVNFITRPGVAALALGNDKTLTPKEVWKKLDADSTRGVIQEKREQSPDKLLYAP